MTNAGKSREDARAAARRLRDDRLLAQRAIDALRDLDEAGPGRDGEVALFRELLAVSGLRHLMEADRRRGAEAIRRARQRVISTLRRGYRTIPLSAGTKRRLARRVGANRWAREAT